MLRRINGRRVTWRFQHIWQWRYIVRQTTTISSISIPTNLVVQYCVQQVRGVHLEIHKQDWNSDPQEWCHSRIECLSNHEGRIQNKTIISFKLGRHCTFMRNAATEIAIPSELRWVTFSGRNMKDCCEHKLTWDIPIIQIRQLQLLWRWRYHWHVTLVNLMRGGYNLESDKGDNRQPQAPLLAVAL